ncbi:type II toxin-antitoxin system RelE/ParE family toxin [Roseovarius dicentrarchi]|uniref:type II toxin-antitoxin system RelE/ParE family toxin n=1 Tax=Roseovarius dicentrarchi TaxID=2250573 RepID=UPI000DE8E9D6|nr:type II toxin-antitoxin system RelE/ParE family toxin [Roseovarius dicentrarchi]
MPGCGSGVVVLPWSSPRSQHHAAVARKIHLSRLFRFPEPPLDTCISLAQNTKRGRAVDVREGYLKQAVGKHLVFYRPTDAGIEVIRILHQSMDVGRHL